jgi:hypothetical protein
MAGINRYAVLPDQNLINTHVEPKYEIIDGALSRMQKVHDDAELLRQKQNDTFTKVETRPISYDIQEKNRLIKSYESDAQEVLDKHNGDYGAAAQELRSLSTKYASDEFWTRNSSAVDSYKEGNKLRNEMRSKGKQILGFDESIFNTRLRNEDGTFNNVNHNLQERLGYIEKADELVKGVAASKWGNFQKVTDPKTGDITIVTTKGERVTETQIKNIVRAGFVNTAEFAQIQAWAYKTSSTEEEAEGKIKQQMGLVEAAMVSKYLKDDVERSATMSREPGSRKGKEKETELKPWETKNATKAFDTEDMEPDRKPWQYNLGALASTISTVGGAGGGLLGTVINWIAGENKPLKLNEVQTGALEKAKVIFNKNPKSDKETAELLSEYSKWLDSQDVEVGFTGIVDTKEQKAAQQYLFGIGNSGSLVARDRGFKKTSGTGKDEGTGAEIFERLPLSKFDYTPQGQYTVDNPSYPKGYSIIVTDRETGEEVATYDMEAPTSDLTGGDKFMNLAYKAKYAADGVSKIPTKNEKGEETFLLIEYDRGTELGPDNKPRMNGNDRARILDAKGKVVVDWIGEGEEADAEGFPVDAIQGVLKRVSSKKVGTKK